MKKNIVLIFIVITNNLFSQKSEKNLLIEKALIYTEIDSENLLNKFVELKNIGNNKTLILLPEINKRDPDCHECFSINNIILIWNNSSEKFESQYIKKDEWYSDAFYLNSLKLDTANYKLKDNTRGFGIRYSFSGSSKVDPASKTYFNLYIPEKNKIKEILHEFTIEDYTGESNGNCETLTMKSSKSILIISKETTNNFNNIIVKTKIKEFHYDEECEKEIITKEFNHSAELKYKEGKYSIQ